MADFDKPFGIPSREMAHFTNRVTEKAAFQRLLDLPEGENVPHLLFYGVGGTGKTWLSRKLEYDECDLPTARIDYESGTISKYDTTTQLAIIRKSLTEKSCPRFDLAFSWLRYKQGVSDEPLFKGTGVLGNAYELTCELASIDGVPGVGLAKFLAKKLTGPLLGKFKNSALAEWLASGNGEKDFLRMRQLSVEEIEEQLRGRLEIDLRTVLPEVSGKQVRGVVFLDGLESLHTARDSESARRSALRPLAELCEGLGSIILCVMTGRDHVHDAELLFTKRTLEQHLIGGLSEPDAREFLTSCEIHDAELQAAMLEVSRDLETPKTVQQASERGDHIPEVGYHPYALGLCADIAFNSQFIEGELDPKTFQLPPGDLSKLTDRFLKSLGDDGTYEVWLERLALTPRFDNGAAIEMLGAASSVEAEAAWRRLVSYSFLKPTIEEDWYTLHFKMRELLNLRTQQTPRWKTDHETWRLHWESRLTDVPEDSPHQRFEGVNNNLAALAWFHAWNLDPKAGIKLWNSFAEGERQASRMANHFSLSNWWVHCRLENLIAIDESCSEAAAAYHALGFELWQASLGNRAENLHRAIECFNTALRVYTEADFPKNWAMTQGNLGNAYGNLPSGDRTENLQRAIDYLNATLRVYTEADFPQDWAATQNNLGEAYRNLPSSNQAENLQRAIDCYNAALRVYTDAVYPQGWAMTQNNLGNAYLYLPSGDRAENLQRAIECYDAALRVSTEADFPQDWAATQNNLGNAYGNLPSGNRAENLQRAIECYNAALRVFTEADFRQYWAGTQNNLGAAFQDLPSGDRAENLQRAIECYNAALRVYTEADFPQHWAETTANIAITEWDAAKEWQPEWEKYGWDREALWQQAEDNLVRAIEVFKRIGHQQYADRFQPALEQLREERDSQ